MKTNEAPKKVAVDPSKWIDDHGDYLFRYALFRLRDPGAAEDVVQETLLAAVKSHQRFEQRSAERTWLVGILKHKIVDQLRLMNRYAALDAIEPRALLNLSVFKAREKWLVTGGLIMPPLYGIRPVRKWWNKRNSFKRLSDVWEGYQNEWQRHSF